MTHQPSITRSFSMIAAISLGLGAAVPLTSTAEETADREQIRQEIQQSLEEAGLDEDEARREAELMTDRLHPQPDQADADAQINADADTDAEPAAPEAQAEQPQPRDDAEAATLTGRIVPVAAFLREQDQDRSPGQTQEPTLLALVTDDEQAYLILPHEQGDVQPGILGFAEPGQIEPEHDEDEDAPRAWEWTRHPGEFRPQDMQRDAAPGNPTNASPGGNPSQAGQQAAGQGWQHHPGEFSWQRDREQTEQQQDDSAVHAFTEPTADEQNALQRIQPDEQVSLTGEIHQRGGLQAIFVQSIEQPAEQERE